jgi:hypothetical protein
MHFSKEVILVPFTEELSLHIIKIPRVDAKELIIVVPSLMKLLDIQILFKLN